MISTMVGIRGGLDNAYTLRMAPGATIHRIIFKVLNAKNSRILLVNYSEIRHDLQCKSEGDYVHTLIFMAGDQSENGE